MAEKQIDLVKGDIEIKTKVSKENGKASGKKTAMKSEPSLRDTLVASYRGVKGSSYELMRDVCSSRMIYVTESDILARCSDYTFRAYSVKNVPAAMYEPVLGLVKCGMKLKYTSKARVNNLMTTIKEHANVTIGFYVSKNGSDETVTQQDIGGKECRYYAVAHTQGGIIGYVPLKRVRSNKKKMTMFYGRGEKHRLVEAISFLKLDQNGVAVKRNDCWGHAEIIFPKGNRNMSYWVRKNDLPTNLNTPCYVMVSGNHLYISMESTNCPGRFHVVVGTTKKFARSRGKKSCGNMSSDDEEEEAMATTTPTTAAPDQEESDGEITSDHRRKRNTFLSGIIESESENNTTSSDDDDVVKYTATQKHKRKRLVFPYSSSEDDSDSKNRKISKKKKSHITAEVTNRIGDETSDSE